MRPGCHVCARVKGFLSENGVPFQIRDVDREPLTPRELWELFNRKASRLRVPFTVLNNGEDVVLGYDPLRLEGVFLQGDLGGWKASSSVQGSSVYDEFTDPALDDVRWSPLMLSQTDPISSTELKAKVQTGCGALVVGVRHFSNFHDTNQVLNDPQHAYVSRERFATPPGSSLVFDVEMAVETFDQISHSVHDAFGAVSVRDLPAGMTLGFGATNDAVFVLHERLLLPGVTATDEAYSHRLITDVVTAPGTGHQYRIVYTHDTGRAQWYVDGELVYGATLPRPVEGFSLSMGLFSSARVAQPHHERAHGQGAEARWRPWRLTSRTMVHS